MKPAESVRVVCLSNDTILIGRSIDTMEELTFLRYPACTTNEGRLIRLAGSPKEVIINDRAIVYDYVSADIKLVAAYNKLWGEAKGYEHGKEENSGLEKT